MNAFGRGGRWAAGGISVALLLGGCTGTDPSAGPATSPASPTEAGSPLACESIAVRDVQVARGDWVLAESVLIRGPEGTRLTVTLSPTAPAGVALGLSTKPGSSETRSAGLDIERATVTTEPATDLDPATLQAALGQLGGDPLALTNAGQPGFTNELEGTLGREGTVAWRGAREMEVTFAGTCSSRSNGQVPVTGSARYFGLGEAGLLDCGGPEPAEPGTLAGIAAQSCTID